jgi:hypothetical protein
MEMFAFVGAVCVEIAVAFAFCVVGALWPPTATGHRGTVARQRLSLCRGLVHGVVVRGLRCGL